MSQVIKKLQSGGSLTIDGIKYDATPEFINALTTHLRDTAGADAQTLAGLSNALLNGQNLRYDSAANTISGMDGEWSGITNRQNQLRRTGSSNWRKWWEAQFDTDAHRFRNALSAIGSFHYQPTEKKDDTSANLKDISSDKQWFEFTKGEDGKEKWNDSVFNSSLFQRIDDVTSWLKDPEAGKKSYRLGSGYTDAYMQAFQNLYKQNEADWDAKIKGIKDRLRAGIQDPNDLAFLKNFFIAKPDATPEETAAAKDAANKKKWTDAGVGGLYDRFGNIAHLNDDGSITLNEGQSWGWNLNDIYSRNPNWNGNIYFNDDFYKKYGADKSWDPLRGYTAYGNTLYNLSNPTLRAILQQENGFNALKDAGDWDAAEDIIMTRFTDAARETPGIFADNKYARALSDHPEYRFTNLTGLYNLPGLKPGEQLIQRYNLDNPIVSDSPYREYAPEYIVLNDKGEEVRPYGTFDGTKIRGAKARDLNAYNRVTADMGGNKAYHGRYYEDIVGKNGEDTGYRVYYDPNDSENIILHMPGINANGIDSDQDIKVPIALGKILAKKFQDEAFLKKLIGNAQNKKDFQMLMSQLVQSWFRQDWNSGFNRSMLHGSINQWWGLFTENNRKKWKDLGFKDQELNEVVNAWKEAKRNRTAGNRDERRGEYLVTSPNIPEEKNGGVLKNQFGGVAGGSTKVQANTARKIDVKNANPKNSAGITEIGGKNWTDADTADVAALLADLGSLGAAFVPGANIASAATGAAGSTARLYADLNRGTKGAGWNYLLNLGMDAATLIPFAGGVANGAKVVRAVKKSLPTIIKAASVYGLGAGVVDTANKIASGQKFTVRDIDMVVNALTAGVGLGKSGGLGRANKTSKTRAYSENFKLGNTEVKLGDAEIKSILKSSDQPKALREAIKKQAPNASDAEVANAAENLLKTKKTLWQKIRGNDGDIVLNAKKKAIKTAELTNANGNKLHDWWYGVGQYQKEYNAQLRGEPVIRQEILMPQNTQPGILNLNVPAVVSRTPVIKGIALPQWINPFTMANRQQNVDTQPAGAVMQPLFKEGGKIVKAELGINTDKLKLNLDILKPDLNTAFKPKVNPVSVGSVNAPKLPNLFKAPTAPTFTKIGDIGKLSVTNPMTGKAAVDTRVSKQTDSAIAGDDQGTFSAEKWIPDLNPIGNILRASFASKQSDEQLKNFLNRPDFQHQDLQLNAPRYINTGTGDAYRNQAKQLKLFKPTTSDALQNDLMARDRQREALNAELQSNLADSQEFGQYKANLDAFINDLRLKQYNISDTNSQLRWQHAIEDIQAKNANIAEKSKFWDQAGYSLQDWYNRNWQTRGAIESQKAYTKDLAALDEWYREQMLAHNARYKDDPNSDAAAQSLASINSQLALKKNNLGNSGYIALLSPMFKRWFGYKKGGKVGTGKRSAMTYSRDPYPELLLQNAEDSTEIVKQLNDAVIKLLLQTKPINVH